MLLALARRIIAPKTVGGGSLLAGGRLYLGRLGSGKSIVVVGLRPGADDGVWCKSGIL